MIDPTSTFPIAVNGDDAAAWGGGAGSIFTATSVGSIIKGVTKRDGVFRFDNISLATGITINSATVNTYMNNYTNGTTGEDRKVTLRAVDSNDPAMPANAGGVHYFSTPAGPIAGTAETLLNANQSGSGGNKAHHLLYQTDVTTIVQNLVNSYTYASQAMSFYMRKKTASGSSYLCGVYHRDWGTLKDPELIINWSPAPPVAKTVFVFI